MPPAGWKKPAGYAGYQRRKPAMPSRARIAAAAAFDEDEERELQRLESGLNANLDALQRGAAAPVDEMEVGNRRRRMRIVLEGDESEDEADEPSNDPQPSVAADADDADDTDAGAGTHGTGEHSVADLLRAELPVVEVSLTLGKHGGHIFPAWQRALHRWMRSQCLAGSVSLERGAKNENLHAQAVLRLRWDPDDMEGLKKAIKEALGVRRGDASGCRIQLAVFTNGQEWVPMLGYIFKDRNKPHFNNLSFNVEQSEIERGIAEWSALKLSYEEDKVMINKSNFFQRVHAYYMNNYGGRSASLMEVLVDMLNSHKYMLSAHMVMGSAGQMREAAASVMWKLIMGELLVEEEVRALFFAPTYHRAGAAVPGQRYYDVPASNPLAVLPGMMAAGNNITATEGPLAAPPASAVDITDDDIPDGAGFSVDKTPMTVGELRNNGKRRVQDDTPLKMQSTFSKRRRLRLVQGFKGANNHEASCSADIVLGSGMDSPRSARDDDESDDSMVCPDHESEPDGESESESESE